jgi:hypothetical protein
LQRQRAIQLSFGQFDLGARIRKLTAGLRGYRFKRAGVDEIQEITCLDEGTIAEFDGGNETADARTNLNLKDRIKPSRELIPVRDGSLGGRIGERPKNERVSAIRTDRVDCSVALISVSSNRAVNRVNPDMRQHQEQEQVVRQSVHAPNRIKQNLLRAAQCLSENG